MSKKISLDFYKAKREGFIKTREEYFNKYIADTTTGSYYDLLKGAPLLVNVNCEGFYILESDIEKLMSFFDRMYWFQKGGDYSILRWKR